MATVDSSVKQAYEDVRNDKNPTTWALFGYKDKGTITLQATGSGSLSELTGKLQPAEAQYGFIRLITDEETKRSKFVFISWVGEEVGRLLRAKVSVHKASVKEVVRDFAVEIHAEKKEELSEAQVLQAVIKAGGANYGTGAARN